MKTIITKEILQDMLDGASDQRRIHIVGHALVVLFKNQTDDERRANTTKVNNGVGFTGADGHSGCLTAKCYIVNRTLQDWQVERWLRKDKSGFARICKYHAQLNIAANNKIGN